jgi:hypothetical protein
VAELRGRKFSLTCGLHAPLRGAASADRWACFGNHPVASNGVKPCTDMWAPMTLASLPLAKDLELGMVALFPSLSSSSFGCALLFFFAYPFDSSVPISFFPWPCLLISVLLFLFCLAFRYVSPSIVLLLGLDPVLTWSITSFLLYFVHTDLFSPLLCFSWAQIWCYRVTHPGSPPSFYHQGLFL